MIRLPFAPANKKFAKSFINISWRYLQIIAYGSTLYGTPKKLSLYLIVKTK